MIAWSIKFCKHCKKSTKSVHLQSSNPNEVTRNKHYSFNDAVPVHIDYSDFHLNNYVPFSFSRGKRCQTHISRQLGDVISIYCSPIPSDLIIIGSSKQVHFLQRDVHV